MFSSHATAKTYKALVYQCSQNVTKFPKHSCSYTVVKSTYNCRNTFAEKQKILSNEITQLIENFTATSTDGTLLVSETLWKNHIDLSQCSSFINSSNGRSTSVPAERDKKKSLNMNRHRS